MAYLIDTSVLGRLADVTDPDYGVALRAVAELHRHGEAVHVTAQNLVEFRNVATRPRSANGLGASAAEAERLTANFESQFSLLDETPAIYAAWKPIVAALGVIGKQVHDARLVAVCHVHAVTHLLTFNVAHFTRLAGFGPGIVVVDPATV